jgi:hypothetical protein
MSTQGRNVHARHQVGSQGSPADRVGCGLRDDGSVGLPGTATVVLI